MNALDTLTDQTLSMTSQEIADLVEKRHDNVKRTIETLAAQGVIESPQIEEIPTATRPATVYVFSGERGKRDSTIVVAQLSPEFTARLVDRWQELEQRLAKPALNPASLSRLQLIEMAMQAEQERIALECKVVELVPKAEALDRFAGHDGQHNLRSATKVLGMQEHKLKAWLLFNRWYYRDHGGRLCAYADKIAAGYLDTIPVEIQRSEGVQVVPQPVITQKGLARLAVALVKDGLLPKRAA